MYALISHVEEIDGFDSPALSPEGMPRPHAHHSPHLGDTMDFRTAADLDELDGLLSPELGGIEFDGERAMYDRNGANNPRGSTLDEVPPGGSVATASVTSPNNGVQPAAVEEEEEKEENEEAGSNPDQPSIALRAATADTTGGAPSAGMSRPDSASSRLGSRPGSARRSISTTPSTRNVDISPVVPDTTLITTASLAAATLEADETPARRQQGEGEWTMNVDSLRANPAASAAGAGGDGDGEGPRSSKNPLSPSSIAHEIRKGRDGFMRVDTINEEASTDLNASFHSVKSAEVPPEDAEEGRDAGGVSSAAPPEEHEESLEPAGEFAVSSDSGTEVCTRATRV